MENKIDIINEIMALFSELCYEDKVKAYEMLLDQRQMREP